MRNVRFEFKDGITEDRDIPAHIIDHRHTIVTSHPSWPVNIMCERTSILPDGTQIFKETDQQ